MAGSGAGRAAIVAVCAAVIASGVWFALKPGPVDAPALSEDKDALAARGEYLVRAAGCIACHTDEENGGAPLAGGRALKTPFGTFYSPNITPDIPTGIGGWSDGDFLTALRAGLSPEGHSYYPVFPFASYTKMRAEDALAIKAYLFTLDPVSAPAKAHDVAFPLNIRYSLYGWRLLNFEQGPVADDESRDATWNRGRYLVDALAHCGECHTPRDATGGLMSDMYLAGTPNGPDGELVPNITPHETGIAEWSEGDIAYLLSEGLKPSYDDVQGSMAEAVRDGLSYLTEDDLNAIAVYLKTIPAVDNTVRSDE